MFFIPRFLISILMTSLFLSSVVLGEESLSHSFQTENYQLLKPFHIQQDKVDGCSLASVLMIVNALRAQENPQAKPWTQSKIRRYLMTGPSKLRSWYQKVRGKGRGVGRNRLVSYLPALLEELYLDGEIEKYRQVRLKHRKKTSLKTFRNDLEAVTHGEHKFMLLNYSAHWSPLGWYDEEESTLRVLDVDSAESYEREYSYSLRQGEEEFDVKRFFYGPMKTRGYILVEVF
ncbi:MAG: hypothetical protein AB8C84_07855 [Oligoflexales bacterium]